MKRNAFNELIKWKTKDGRKPLIVKGARQVGKSYLLREFGRAEFENFFVFDFEIDPSLRQIFEPDLIPERILVELSMKVKKRINAKTDLIIFDEIQECPAALTSLKYFCEQANEFAICCAGSLLGVKLSAKSFPVGKVDFLDLYPLNFEEFLLALDDNICIEAFYDGISKNKMSLTAHQMIWQKLCEYYLIGGLPEIVSKYVSLKSDPFLAISTAREMQKALVEAYIRDFAKHSGKINSFHIVSVFENIPLQLSQCIDDSVQRYRFKDVIPGKKSFLELQGPIQWLESAGLIIKVKICERPEIPLESFCKNNIFKLFFFDVGLLGQILKLPPESLLHQNYGMTKGYFAENFVAQEMISNGQEKLYSWNHKNSEIEFVRHKDNYVEPIEVKSGTRTQAKSLLQFISKYQPPTSIKLTANPMDINSNPNVKHYPLYYAGIA